MTGSNDGFVNGFLTLNNLDRYIIRKAILNALKSNLNYLHGKLLDAGCGKMPYRKYILEHSKVVKYIGLDIESALKYDDEIKPDYTWDGKVMPFTEESFDCCMATEVLEHCPDPEVFLKEVYRTLRPGSLFFFTVPFLWNLHETPHDEYRYTPFSLERHLKNSGFVDISIKATGGWHAALAQMMGLWVRRAPMPVLTRKILSCIILPFYKILIQKDRIPQKFSEGVMITGLAGSAYKR